MGYCKRNIILFSWYYNTPKIMIIIISKMLVLYTANQSLWSLLLLLFYAIVDQHNKSVNQLVQTKQRDCWQCFFSIPSQRGSPQVHHNNPFNINLHYALSIVAASNWISKIDDWLMITGKHISNVWDIHVKSNIHKVNSRWMELWKSHVKSVWFKMSTSYNLIF